MFFIQNIKYSLFMKKIEYHKENFRDYNSIEIKMKKKIR